MSTELKPRSKNYFLTQFCGPERHDGVSRMRLQVTGSSSFRAPYFTVGKDEVVGFIAQLTKQINELDDEEGVIYANSIELPQVSAKRLCLDLLDWSNDALTEHNY